MEFVKKNLQNFKSFYEEPLVDENEQNKEELSEKEKK